MKRPNNTSQFYTNEKRKLIFQKCTKTSPYKANTIYILGSAQMIDNRTKQT